MRRPAPDWQSRAESAGHSPVWAAQRWRGQGGRAECRTRLAGC